MEYITDNLPTIINVSSIKLNNIRYFGRYFGPKNSFFLQSIQNVRCDVLKKNACKIRVSVRSKEFISLVIHFKTRKHICNFYQEFPCQLHFYANLLDSDIQTKMLVGKVTKNSKVMVKFQIS